jgi:phosphatidylinositol alpha-mannosyltransferase
MVLSPVPTVATFHAAGQSAPYRYLRPLAHWLARRLTVRCAVSYDARDLAARYLGGDYVLLHNGIDVEWFAKATPSPTTGPTVAFVSRHEQRKGLGVLLAALAHLPKDVRLWVASDGPETPELKAQVAGDPRVEWLGRITEEEKAQRIRGADVLCAPSLRGESFGLVLLEGMAAQTPVVASDLPGYRNVGRQGREALLVPPGDAAALARAIKAVLDDRSLAATLVAGGEARAAEFSMDRLAERYLDLYAVARDREGARRPITV